MCVTDPRQSGGLGSDTYVSPSEMPPEVDPEIIMDRMMGLEALLQRLPPNDPQRQQAEMEWRQLDDLSRSIPSYQPGAMPQFDRGAANRPSTGARPMRGTAL